MMRNHIQMQDHKCFPAAVATTQNTRKEDENEMFQSQHSKNIHISIAEHPSKWLQYDRSPTHSSFDLHLHLKAMYSQQQIGQDGPVQCLFINTHKQTLLYTLWQLLGKFRTCSVFLLSSMCQTCEAYMSLYVLPCQCFAVLRIINVILCILCYYTLFVSFFCVLLSLLCLKKVYKPLLLCDFLSMCTISFLKVCNSFTDMPCQKGIF